MSIAVFLGPSLARDEAMAVLDAEYLPPAAEGDLYRVARQRPLAIGLIDGYFESIPAVWHKEILYALRAGIHVYGCSSMGALRAVELAMFGMEGVGAVFEAYRSGHLEDDDEVAVLHAPGELGYLNLSEAMVNIRRTLSDAMSEGVISLDTRESLEQTAKRLSYRDRTYANIMRLGHQSNLADDELDRLRDWLPTGRVDQKREDALLMLRTMRDRVRAGVAPKEVSFHFEHTAVWESARTRA